MDNLDYLPFGEQIAGDTGTTHKFTGQERDSETGLDNFLARHMAPAQGRFLSPDPIGNFVADPGNPQSWNLYSYVMNNPLAFVDPSGTCAVVDGQYQEDGGDPCPPPPNTTITVSEPAPPPLPYDNCILCEEVMGGGGPNVTNLPLTNPELPQLHKMPSWWDCTRSGTDYFSLQNGLRSLTGGRLGNGWLWEALLGNTVQSVGDTARAIANLDFGGVASTAGGLAVEHTAGTVATKVASKVPDIGITVGIQAASLVQTPTSVTSVSVTAEASLTLPTGALARAGAGALSETLETLGLVKLPYDIAVAGFSGLVCGLGR